MMTTALPRIEPVLKRILMPASMIGVDGAELLKVMRDRDMHPALFGSMPRGIHAKGDIVTTTADGVDLNRLWNEFQQTMQAWNAKRDRLVGFLSYPVTQPSEFVYQGGSVTETSRDPWSIASSVVWRSAPPAVNVSIGAVRA